MNEKPSSPKIEITAEKLKTYLGVFSVCFLISGILYNYIYLGSFGIEISKFCTFQDYLSSSIEKILINLTVLFFFVLIDTMVPDPALAESDISKSRMNTKHNKSRIWRFIMVIISIIVIIVISIIQIRKDAKGYYTMAVGISLGISFLLTVGYSKYLHKPRKTFFVLTVITFFLGLICADALYDAATIRNGDINKIKRYTMTFDKKLDINESGLVLLGTSSNYYFLYDKISKNTHIIPSNSIVSISVKKNH